MNTPPSSIPPQRGGGRIWGSVTYILPLPKREERLKDSYLYPFPPLEKEKDLRNPTYILPLPLGGGGVGGGGHFEYLNFDIDLE